MSLHIYRSEKQKEVVIINTNKINDMIENISPIHPDKCPPVIPNSDKTLREICYKRAHEIYGEDLPERVTSRLEKRVKFYHWKWICGNVHHCAKNWCGILMIMDINW